MTTTPGRGGQVAIGHPWPQNDPTADPAFPQVTHTNAHPIRGPGSVAGVAIGHMATPEPAPLLPPPSPRCEVCGEPTAEPGMTSRCARQHETGPRPRGRRRRAGGHR